MDRRKELLARAYFVVSIFSMIALVIAYKVINIGIIERAKWKAEAAKNVKWMEVDADRGNIYADDESLLATSIQFFEIRMDMRVANKELFKENVDSLALMLSKTVRTDKTASEWRKDLYRARKNKNGFLYIAKGLDAEAASLLRTFPLFRDGKYKGGYVELRYGTRKKPFGQLASRTIGADRENAQKVGIEGRFDKFLKGPTDKRLMKKIDDLANVWVPVYDPSEFEPKKGDDIVTTLNVHLQDVVHSELEKQLLKSNAAAGTAVLMEVKTGAIKAISNLVIQDSQGVEVLNTAVSNSTEPGSTFKLATVLALLEDSLVNENSLVNINGGQMKFSDKIMHDSEKPVKNLITLTEAFALSSNVGIAKFANDAYNRSEAGRSLYRSRLAQFRLDHKSGVDVDGEPTPFIKDPVKNKKDWYGTTIPWMAHGYETTMTPLQMLNFYSSVANGGKMMKPYIVSEIRNSGKTKKKFNPVVLAEQIAKKHNIERVKVMMESVFTIGTARSLKSTHLTLAGKSGTTRINYANKAEYAKYNASFCGYFPAEDPQYAMIVVMYEPKGAFYGSAVAAPVFKAVAEKTMAWKFEMAPNYMNDTMSAKALTLPDKNIGFSEDFLKLFDYLSLSYKKNNTKSWVNVVPFNSKMVLENKSISIKVMPDVVGMGARDAMYVLENIGLSVSLYGKGKVERQSIAAGSPISGQKIEIFLK
jgi:cell division protein FtsI (penicillin-binding protein 3)